VSFKDLVAGWGERRDKFRNGAVSTVEEDLKILRKNLCPAFVCARKILTAWF
jgi:hypothetical protein